MKLRIRTRVAVCAVWLTPVAGCASAQANPDSVKHRNDCRLATQVLTHGQPANRRSWAISFVRDCRDSESKAAILTALAAARQTTDLSPTVGIIMIARDVQDGDFFESIVATAGDRSASTVSRVASFMAFVEIVNPTASADYEKFISINPADRLQRGTCNARMDHSRTTIPGLRALPADYLGQIVAVTRRVRDDPTEPREIRSAAACAS